MNEVYELINGIISAQEELLKDKIIANTVIINSKKYGKLIEEGFYPTVCGMACDFAPLPDDFAFAVQYRKPDIPTTETVPVVRCKDCKHSEPWYGDRSRCFLWVEDGVSVFNDGFCSYGERKDDENETTTNQ